MFDKEEKKQIKEKMRENREKERKKRKKKRKKWENVKITFHPAVFFLLLILLHVKKNKNKK